MLLKNCKIIENNLEREVDIEISKGVITAIEAKIEKDDNDTIDIGGKLLLPGVVDLNFNINNIASKKVESFEEAINGAYRGGITSVLMHSDKESINNESSVSYAKLKADSLGFENVYILGESTTECKLNNVALMYKSGAQAISIESCEDSNLIRRSLEYTKNEKLPLIVYPKDKALESEGVMHDGDVSAMLGLPGLPGFAESCAVAKVSEIALGLDSSVFFAYVSSKSSLDIVENAKGRGEVYSAVPVTNLFMNDSFCNSFNTNNKTFPPLRSNEDRLKLIAAVKEGVIDVISSNHRPKSYVSKDVPFEEASFGIATSAIFLPLIYTKFIKTGIFSWEEIIKAVATNPAKILGENKGSIAAGKDADLVVFDTESEYVVSNYCFESKTIGNICSFEEDLQGIVERVFIKGREVI